ncbi:MAG TPA: ROK family protein [Candidatus Binatia bacterium]|nr:ROK family protein [Candidatus Binatia bacterium]
MPKKISRASKKRGDRTLVVDIGASGIKALVLDAAGRPLTVRDRIKTPSPSTPGAVLNVIRRLARRQGRFDRVAVGFPSVIRNGVVETASNLGLDQKWCGFRLAEKLESKLGRPVRVANDADLQGFGAISGRGVELVITLGTGFGSALFVDGKLVPNLEVALYPLDGKTYGRMLGEAARKKVGNKKWNKRLSQVIEVLYSVFNYDHLYIGGGNSIKVKQKLPRNVRIVPNTAGLLGGIALWKEYG